MDESKLLEYMERRADARKAKDFAAADAIREELTSRGIMLMDGGDGTKWRPTVATRMDDVQDLADAHT